MFVSLLYDMLKILQNFAKRVRCLSAFALDFEALQKT
jgi:hypothetical protein